MSRTARSWRATACLWTALLSASAAAGAPTPFVASLVPRSDGGWWVRLGGIDAIAGVELWLDGSRLEATPAPIAGSALLVPPLPAGSRRLELRRRGQTVAALRLQPLEETARELASWTIYDLVLEMFANGDPANDGQLAAARHPRAVGGDLRGVLAKADYLSRLGVDAVLLSPIFPSPSSAGGGPPSYYHVGDAVGVPSDAAASLALFREVRSALEQRGIRTLLDLPLVRASRSYDRAAGDPLRLRPKSAAIPRPGETHRENSGARELSWDFGHAATREFLKQAAIYWLREEKVDGLRLDGLRAAPHDFWAELFRAVKQARRDAFLLGDCWPESAGPDADARELASYHAELPDPGRQFDALLDCPLQSVLNATFAGHGSLAEAEAWLQHSAALYPEDALPANFLDGRDLARFADRGGDRATLLAALGYLATLDGPLVLFYGTETALGGGATTSEPTDGGRLPMPWSGLDVDLVGRVAGILAGRAAHPAAYSGARLPLLVEEKRVVVARTTGVETLFVGVNLTAAPSEVEVEVGALVPPGSTLEAVIGEAPALVDEQGRLRWTLPAMATVVVAFATPPSG